MNTSTDQSNESIVQTKSLTVKPFPTQLTNDYLPVTQVNTQAYTPLIIIIWGQFFLTLIKTFDTFED